MAEIEFREWQAVWLQAVVEPISSSALPKLVKDAEAAINLRIQALRTISAEIGERRVLGDALKSLRYLRNEHFKYSTVATVNVSSDTSTG